MPRTTPARSRPVTLGLFVSAALVAAVIHWSPASSATFGKIADRATPTSADGVLPSGVGVFDEDHPGVTRLDPELLRALRRAATAAAEDGIRFYVNSGWRSPAYQDRLLGQAVAKYGSEAEAARWVATAETSPHVAGQAVDIGRPDAAAWLAEHGGRFGLCRIYRNEPWHFELRPDGCPVMYDDPSQDPRMSRS